MSVSNSIEIANSDQELVGSAKKRRQFLILGGLCALAVIVVAAIVLSVVLISNSSEPEDSKEELKLDDILYRKLSPQTFNGTWIDDNTFQYELDGNLMIYDVAQKKSELFVSKDNTQFLSASSYSFSFDKKYILTDRHIVRLYRHSYFALWDVYDVERKVMIPVTIGGKALAYRLVKFSPVDNSMIIVYDNNIYYKKSPTAPEIQITNDGSIAQGVSNGVPDWVYEEEVFSSNSATWFSPDGKKIAYIQFDDSKVPVMNLPVYGGPGDPAYQYPQTLPVNYPKVATKNPEVKLFYVDLSSVTDAVSVVRHEIPVPVRFINNLLDHIITSVSWANNNDLIAVFMNRVQSKADIQKCSTTSGSPDCVEAKKLDVEGGWVEFFTPPFFNKDGTNMIYVNSVDGFRHVVSLNLNTFVETPRTSGKFVVTQILKFNKDKNVVIFTANTETDSKVQHVYAVKDEANAVKVCLTCTPSSYSYFSVDVSIDGGNLVISASGPDVPQTHLYTLDVKDNITLTNHIEIQSNEALRKILENKKLPRIIYDKIVLENGSESQVMMAVPSNLDENAVKKYPMIVEVYGGPDSSSVTNRWSIEWGSYMVSSRDIIYAKIDGRGSGLRGDKNLFALYRKLGNVEIHDQVETAEKLQKKYPYIDSARSAIWGWSYGGYVSGMSLMNDSSVYKCAVSVAPVTDWTLYDSIYTERYMGLPTPQDNAKAYENSRLMNFVDNIKKNNKTYMLVHGTLDDNVHFQQGMMLARALERKDIQFKEITYPDEDHSLAGVRPHLYHSLERFFDGCFEESN